MKKLLLSVSVVMGMTAGQALAADIAPPPAFDWTGFYLGLNAGYGFNGFYGDDVAVTGYGHIGSLDVNGGFFGGQVGYNYQINQIVLGLEGDVQWAALYDNDHNNKVNAGMSSDPDWFGTLRGRAGFAVDQALFYATGGLAWGQTDYKVQIDKTVDIHDDYFHWGWAAGAGVEYAFDSNWSAKLEYLYVNLGQETISDGKFKTEATPDFQTVRIGVNYRF